MLNIAAIARALDATTASAIWSRFRAGQRGVMVRSIYTVDGRTTFDEVQRRYKAEPAFRETVDRYMLDFEQLLRDGDQRDPRAARRKAISRRIQAAFTCSWPTPAAASRDRRQPR